MKNTFLYRLLKNIYLYVLIFYFSLRKNYYKGIDPVFLVSTNRSGSSLIASILRQHPKLRSLSEDVANSRIQKKNNHTYGFAEDFIWNFLDNQTHSHFTGKDEGFLWAHPKNISYFYRDDFFLKKALIYEIFKKKSDLVPFVKHSFFSLRLKLIKKIFPNSKIIFNIRSYKDFIRSNIHKWSSDPKYSKIFENSKPDIGLHWFLINSIIIHDLNKYFENQFIIVNHEKFYDEKFNNQEIMNEITDFLELEKYNFNFENVNKKFKFSKEIDFEYKKLEEIYDIYKYEKKIFEDWKK